MVDTSLLSNETQRDEGTDQRGGLCAIAPDPGGSCLFTNVSQVQVQWSGLLARIGPHSLHVICQVGYVF